MFQVYVLIITLHISGSTVGKPTILKINKTSARNPISSTSQDYHPIIKY